MSNLEGLPQTKVSPSDFMGQAELIIASHRPAGLPENFQPVNMDADYAPYPFTEQDLKIDRLMPGVEYTLQQFYSWRDNNLTAIENYIIECQKQLASTRAEYSRARRIRRLVLPAARRDFKQTRRIRELTVFGIRNLAETPDQERLARFDYQTLPYSDVLEKSLKQTTTIAPLLAGQFPLLGESPEGKELETKLMRLYHSLPESVVRDGAMGKIARTALGVGAIAAYDMIDATPEEKKERFAHVMHGAVVYGAVYALIDDTLHDTKNYLSSKDRERYNETILEGLRTGKPIDTTRLPDHPLTDEIKTFYDLLTEHYPIEKYPHLFHAAESMFIAQDRDAQLTMEYTQTRDLTDLYPNILVKSGMSRVIANILADRELDAGFYTRCLNSMIVHQFRDDLIDYEEDLETNRVTTFTYPHDENGTNPLYDMFAYDAYLADTVYPNAEPLLAYSQVVFLSHYLSLHPDRVDDLLQRYGTNTPKALGEFVHEASHLPESTIYRLTPVDQRIKSAIGKATAQRNQIDVDPRTFVLDRLETINDIIQQFVENGEQEEPSNSELRQIMKYALEAGGKRLRPALTLMLAESLQVDRTSITPLLLASELFHTASLLFDDLPWQDNSDIRRGKPTAHTVFDPASVELTGVAMLLEGIKELQTLKNHYTPKDVSAVTTYTTNAIQAICLGQSMDLQMAKSGRDTTTLDKVLEMYHLKTAVAMEASLVPLMMLEKRPQTEIESIKLYAHHAGLVFQIKDDLLDVSSSVEALGKNVQKDSKKINVVQLYSIDKAEELMETHLQAAINACQTLRFNTNLLQGIVTYFAKRRQ